MLALAADTDHQGHALKSKEVGPSELLSKVLKGAFIGNYLGFRV